MSKKGITVRPSGGKDKSTATPNLVEGPTIAPSGSSKLDNSTDDLDRYRLIYFIECQDFIKIGWCKLLNIYRRRSELQGGNPFKLEVIGVIFRESGNGIKKEENALHKRFGHLRHRNEWFRKCPELLNYVQEHTENADLYLQKGLEYEKIRN